jgi:hypothetical protein
MSLVNAIINEFESANSNKSVVFAAVVLKINNELSNIDLKVTDLATDGEETLIIRGVGKDGNDNDSPYSMMLSVRNILQFIIYI